MIRIFRSLPFLGTGFIGSNSLIIRVIGKVQLRQLRSKIVSCTIPEKLSESNFSEECHKIRYSESKESFGPNNMFQYSDPDSDDKIWGTFGDLYPEGGFIESFAPTMNDTLALATRLKVHTSTTFSDDQTNNWIDQQTRLIVVRFPVLNLNLNLMSYVKMIVEIPASGRMFPIPRMQTVRAFWYQTSFDYFILV